MWLVRYLAFSTQFYKRHDLRRNVTDHRHTHTHTHTHKIFLILRRTEHGMSITAYWSWCNVSLFLPEFIGGWIFSTHFRRIIIHQISWKSICLEPNCSKHTEWRTDRTNLTVACFRKYCGFQSIHSQFYICIYLLYVLVTYSKYIHI